MSEKTVRREQSVERHLLAAAEWISVAESDDPARSAYEHAAIEIDAAMQEDQTLTQKEVGRRIGKSDNYVGRLLQALRRARRGEEFRVDWQNYGRNRDQVGAQKIAREQPEAFADAFEKAPPEARQRIAQRLSQSPEVRIETRKHDFERTAERRPSPVKPRSDHLLYQYASKLSSADRQLREALALVAELDQPGDDEDILDDLRRLRELVAANEEAYRTGKSIDTWAAELYKEAGER